MSFLRTSFSLLKTLLFLLAPPTATFYRLGLHITSKLFTLIENPYTLATSYKWAYGDSSLSNEATHNEKEVFPDIRRMFGMFSHPPYCVPSSITLQNHPCDLHLGHLL